MRSFVYCYIFITSFLLSFLLVPLFKRIAVKRGILDYPNERKIHQGFKPLLGGLAIYTSFMIVILANVFGLLLLRSNPLFAGLLPEMVRQVPRLMMVLPGLMAILAGGSLVVLIGLIDDIRGPDFSYKIKFCGQVAAALILALGGVRTSFMPTPLLNYLITVLWVVGITNAFNFLDNMDGLSAGVATISSLIFFTVTARQGQFFSALILLVYAGSALGFLPYNFYPSKIFMGDAGSMFLGYVLGALTVISSYVTPKSASLLPVIMPLIILGVPLFDTLSVIYIRLRERRPIYIGDRRHFSHRLVDLGMSQREAVIFIYLVTFCVGITATLLPEVGSWESILILVQAGVILGIITFLMIVGDRERRKDR